MILKRLFSQLWKNGIVIVATSNRKPDGEVEYMYKNWVLVDYFCFCVSTRSHFQIKTFQTSTKMACNECISCPSSLCWRCISTSWLQKYTCTSTAKSVHVYVMLQELNKMKMAYFSGKLWNHQSRLRDRLQETDSSDGRKSILCVSEIDDNS